MEIRPRAAGSPAWCWGRLSRASSNEPLSLRVKQGVVTAVGVLSISQCPTHSNPRQESVLRGKPPMPENISPQAVKGHNSRWECLHLGSAEGG